MRTVHVDVKVHMILKLDEGVEIEDFLNEMDYGFTPSPECNGEVVDTEIIDHEVTDSR